VAGLVGLLAGVLGALGLHALIASVVTERRQEFGLRLALGATTGRLSTDVVRQALRLAGLGVVCGLGVALPAAGLLRSQLYGTSPFDLAVYAAVLVSAMLVSAFAAWLPARTSARMDPLTALRA
jgi:ABC-type antimicrobial peptide transport system permease subunit